METVRSVLAAVHPGDYAVSLDLEDAYFHIPIHPASRRFLRFTDGIDVFQFRALPFGLSLAPRVFTRVMLVIASTLRSQGIRLIQYLDDWLLLDSCPTSLRGHLARSVELVSSLGLIINPRKSDLLPSQEFIFLGILFKTHLNRICLAPERFLSLENLVRVFLRTSRVRVRFLLSLLGVLNSAADLVPLGRLHLRPLQLVLLSLWRPIRQCLHTQVQLPPDFHNHLRWWLRPEVSRGVPLFLPPPSVFLFTDASLEGWGAHLEPLGLCVSGQWSVDQSHDHINLLELRAVLLSLQHFQAHVFNQHVLLSSDNMSVVSYVRRQGGTHSPSLTALVGTLLRWCQSHSITLSSRHLPGRLNALADRLSRNSRPLVAEWTLCQSVLQSVFHFLGLPMVDLFATRWNHRLPLYVSPVLDPAAFAVDAMSMDWESIFAYAFPPFTLLPPVLRKIRSSKGCCIILIAPLWPNHSWFNDLLDLLVESPIPLPLRSDLLYQDPGRRLHHNPGMLHLHAWKLSSVESDRRNFLKRLPRWSPDLGVPLPRRYTTPSGSSSVIGVVRGRLILQHLLFSS